VDRFQFKSVRLRKFKRQLLSSMKILPNIRRTRMRRMSRDILSHNLVE
jgi:hypothetical protein